MQLSCLCWCAPLAWCGVVVSLSHSCHVYCLLTIDVCSTCSWPSFPFLSFPFLSVWLSENLMVQVCSGIALSSYHSIACWCNCLRRETCVHCDWEGGCVQVCPTAHPIGIHSNPSRGDWVSWLSELIEWLSEVPYSVSYKGPIVDWVSYRVRVLDYSVRYRVPIVDWLNYRVVW